MINWDDAAGILKKSNNVPFLVLEEIPHYTLADWFSEINKQYQTLNQYSAYFAWELSTSPTSEILSSASKFGSIRNKWKNKRCSEGEEQFEDMSTIQKRMIRLLCRGPKYTDFQASELSTVLSQMQNIYTETQICLPSGFDICLNYKRIWNYTYVRSLNDEITHLNMVSVLPIDHLDFNPLHYYDGKLSSSYYVLRNDEKPNPLSTDDLIRQSYQFCLNAEPDLEKVMQGNFTYLQRQDCALPVNIIFRWAWEAWRLAVGPIIGKLYPTAVYLMNLGAKNNGYNDIGECWQEELEMHDLPLVVSQLWNGVKWFYQLLHAILRDALWKKFDGDEIFTIQGTLPAHLLGNMWAQDWSVYHNLLMPFSTVNIDESFTNTNWSSSDLVRRAEDFFSSMGLNPMPKKFWNLSKFDKTSNSTKCHGSAANMFKGDDFRMIVCAQKSIDDFYVIVHEMGHIQYYMHLNQQPPIFQEATNSAFGETIGDTIFLAMMTPQHLNRLNLIPDENLFANTIKSPTNLHKKIKLIHEQEIKPRFLHGFSYDDLLEINNSSNDFSRQQNLYNLKKEEQYKINFEPIKYSGTRLENIIENEKNPNNINFERNYDYNPSLFDINILLRSALSKIPQIPFEFIVDKFRWDLFSGKISFENANDYFWRLIVKEQGIHAPDWKERHNFFDPGAKFHIADNTPYVRYFLASFLQFQVFKGLCEKTVFGRVNTKKPLPMPLHRCDIYGSKRAGNLLKKAMKLGASEHWSQILYILTGKKTISIEPLLEYYKPLIVWLQKIIIKHRIPVGW